MITVKTIDTQQYVATVRTEATITDKATGFVLATASEAGQVGFVAIGNEVTVTDDDAVVVPASLQSAPGSSIAGSGERIEEMIQSALGEEVKTQVSTPAGTDNANFVWCQIDGSRVLPGTVKAISLPGRTTAAGAMSVQPVYLSVFQLVEGVKYRYVGTSVDAVAQAVGRESRWTFEGLELDARTTRLCPVPDRSTEWTDDLVLGGRVSAVTGEESKITPLAGSSGGSKYLVEATFDYVRQAYKFAREAAFATHVGDAIAHVTTEEREAWNNGVIPVDQYGYPRYHSNGFTLGGRGFELRFTAMPAGATFSANWGSSTGAESGQYTLSLEEIHRHLTDTTAHLSEENRAGLEELLARREELLALLPSQV